MSDDFVECVAMEIAKVEIKYFGPRATREQCMAWALEPECYRGAARAVIALIWPKALEEAAKVAEKLSDDWDTEWRDGLKCSSHLEGKSDGAHEVAATIRALKEKSNG